MKETTQKRLIVFSRLWAIPMILFVVLAVVAVIACMDENKDLMGAAVVGTVIMMIIQLCQLVAAIVVRRWWCLFGGVVGVLVSVFVLTCSIVALAAGQYRPPVTANGSDEEALPDTVTFFQEEDQMSCNIVALVPESAVSQAVGEWLDSYLGKGYTGDKTDVQSMVDFYGKLRMDSLRSIIAGGVPDFAVLNYDACMDKLYENGKVVTYGLTITLDLGGAHPVTKEVGATFCKDDGRQLKWDIVRKDCMADFQNVIHNMLKDYFGAKNDGELMGNLQGVKDVKHIPMPATPPYMMEDGIVLIYQQYEIASYAMGMPCDTIPYKVIKPYLTEETQQLINE